MCDPTISGTTRLLVVKPTSLGDIVQSLCAVTAIKRFQPSCHVTFLVADVFSDIVAGHPSIDSVMIFPRTQMKRGLTGLVAGLSQLRSSLRSQSFDIVLDLQGLARSALAGWFSSARVRVGFADSREGASLFYTHKVSADRKGEHAVIRYLKAAEPLGAPFRPEEAESGLRQTGDALLKAGELVGGATIGLVPGARWETKIWPLHHFIELASRLVSDGYRVALFGSNAEKELCEAIADALPQGSCENLAGRTTLRELAACLQLCKVVVSNDSGPMHLSAAVGTPTVSMFGPTDPALVAPWGFESLVVRSPLPCVGCYRRKCDRIALACMEAISPDSVMEAVLRALNLKERRD